MEVAYSHAQNQRLLKQRNLLLLAASALAVLAAILLLIGFSRDREVVLQPVLRSPLTISSAGVSREYLELITRDVVVLTLDRPIAEAPAIPAFAKAVKRDERTLEITYDRDRVTAGQVLAMVQQQGFAIEDVTTREADLEDVFVQLTSRDAALGI